MNDRHAEWDAAYGNIGCSSSVLTNIPIDILEPWTSSCGEKQPFQMYSDSKMQELADNIAKNGVIEPICIRPLPNGKYQIVAGHNRAYAAQLAGLTTVPASVKSMTDEEAAIRMVDSNLQHRETILPSELAHAYKVKLDAIGHRQGQRNDLTSNPVDRKLENGLESAEIVGIHAGTSAAQVRRYLRLLYLIPDLLTLVDKGKLKMRPAVELSFLTEMEQSWVSETISTEGAPSLKQAVELKKMSKAGTLTMDAVLEVYLEEKPKKGKNEVSFKLKKIQRYFPANYTAAEIEDKILDIIQAWSKKEEI